MWEYLCGNEKQVQCFFPLIVVHHLLNGWVSSSGFCHEHPVHRTATLLTAEDNAQSIRKHKQKIPDAM